MSTEIFVFPVSNVPEIRKRRAPDSNLTALQASGDHRVILPEVSYPLLEQIHFRLPQLTEQLVMIFLDLLALTDLGLACTALLSLVLVLLYTPIMSCL